MFDMKNKQSSRELQLSSELSESLEASTPTSYEKNDAASTTSSRELVSQYFRTEIQKTNVDVVVLLCWFVTGLLDGTIFNGMSNCRHPESTSSHLQP